MKKKKFIIIGIIVVFIIISMSFTPFNRDTRQIYRNFENMADTLPLDYEHDTIKSLFIKLRDIGFKGKKSRKRRVRWT